MKTKSTRNRVVYAAMAGLLTVATQIGCGQQQKTESPAPASPAAQPAAEESMEKHACKGMNACSGKGGCKVEGQNECSGKNPCKGKGGCKTA